MNFKKNKDKIFNITLFVIYLVITLISVFHHELWRDEAQVWLVSRDLSLYGIYDHVRNEGHPLLWYYLVLPFAKLNLNVIFMQLLSWLFMAGAAFLFLFKSPFNKLSKFCILFSAGFLYWLPVISRNYSLIPLFLFLSAYFYTRQKEKPYLYAFFVSLLSQTHILMCGFCTGLAALFYCDNLYKNKEPFEQKKPFFYSFLIMLLSVFTLFLYITSRTYQNISIQRFIFDHGINVWKSFVELFLNLYGSLNFLWLIAAALLILAASIIIYKENRKLFFVYIFSFIYQFYIYIFVWQTSPEKAYTFLLTIVFCFWIILCEKTLSEKKSIFYNVVMGAIFALSFQVSYQVTLNDINYDYSGSKKTAEYIKNNISDDAVIISNNPLTTAGIFAYLPGRKFYSPNYKDFYTLGFNQNLDLTVPFEFEADKNDIRFKDKQIYYIYCFALKPDTDKKVIYQPVKTILIPTEEFYIFKD